MANAFCLKKRFVIAVFAICLGTSNIVLHAEDSKNIYYIEENWELVLGEPDPKINSPQVSFFVYPDSGDESRYFELQLNYAADATYSSGGFRVTAASNDQIVDHERGGNFQNWTVANDRIQWTTVMAVQDSRYLFAIKNGQSSDWGSFGGPDYLVEMPHGSGKRLSNYHPDKSLANVDIGFGANRVDSILLKSVRVIYSDGSQEHVSVNASPTSIH
ncbi:hypothetical protein LOC71_18375 [Rhodopirellula sp. JC740]|uniref:Secreted protein n=1 Tax=Rhodopirellula halodulae TaxID=2894198 RepID=A0ABS8NL01_9BACT|nr:hypothetical protein [Rhodopirellula sp. JC740]MCC9644247.1 hypothetical protein [Rhodopirellula sp. JC740]